jgi:hypothetical protein
MIYLRSNKTMFINSQVGLLSPEKLANYAVLAAGLSNRWGSVCGIIQGIGTVFGELIDPAVNDATASFERNAECTDTVEFNCDFCGIG